MAAGQVHLHIMTNNPTKYDQITSYGFRGVEFTECHGHGPLLFPSVTEQQEIIMVLQ